MPKSTCRRLGVAAVLGLAAPCVLADDVLKAESIEVNGHYDNSVGSSDAASAGVITPRLIEERPKAALVFGPWNKTEYFVNAGYGFHSNDARGVTIRVDPKSGDAVDPTPARELR